MKKSTCHQKCKKCGSYNVKYYGYVDKHRRRYYCKSCGRTFIDNPKFEITSTTERFINALYNMLKNDFYGERKFKKSFEKARNEKTTDKIKCISKHIQDTACGYYIDKCENPKLIICTDYNKLVFYKIPKSRSQKICKISIE